MSDKRDDRVDEKLGKISSLVKHSKEELKTVALDDYDILNDLPRELIEKIKIEAPHYGTPINEALKELRDIYSKYLETNKLNTHGGHRFQNNERRQDNVHEREVDKNLQRQRELIHGRGGRRYERQRVHG